MGFREDSFGADRQQAERSISDYVRHQRRVRGELQQEEFPVCGDCHRRHSPYYDCGK